ncbi:protein of unknown function [Nakamurella panacisegetis]|uniref:Protein-glutamine gamma-glutamyltransferase-like C-terminal domain-containing protein n=1 Tax=Nakamurella panacisegetis TaxID=1090615 RepID=A0A1H0PE87_9ACTN|nr:DUF4129 domain-containing protein [Nakamurella panacisegetis]SDP03323.1 protein of unknown function [Nakamurella panacisegetis]
MIRSRRPTPTAPVRVGLLVATGVLLTGAALWAGANGPWTGRPERTRSEPTDLPTLPTFTPPTLPTRAPVNPRTGTGSSFDPTIVLLILGGVLLVALVLMAGSMIRNRSDGAGPKRPKSPVRDEVIPSPSQPDPARPFDTREAADYVIASWEQVERQAGATGFGRGPAQTPTEFLDALRAAYPMDERACAELLALYQRARFDHVRLRPDTAARARACADIVLGAITASWSPP